MPIPIRVLIVEDSAADAELMLGNLADHGFAPQAERVETEAAYLAGLNAVPDVILADYRLPRFSGPRALELLNARAIDIPFIAVSGTVSDVQAANLIKAGACDFLLKDRMARLGPAVSQAMASKRARDEQRAFGQALAESEEKLRSITASTPDAIAMINAKGSAVLWNAAAERMFGYTEAEVLGNLLAERIVPERFRAAHNEGFERFLVSGEGALIGSTREVTALRKDGTEFPVELSLSAVSVHGEHHAIGILRNITERKQAEDALRQQTGELRARNEELTRFNRATADRELRMIALKQEVNDLAAKLDLPQPYALAFMNAAAAQIVRSVPKPTEPQSFSESSKTSNPKE